MEKSFNREFSFITSKSSGPGGQNVNKVNTKVILCFHVNNSEILATDEKLLIHEKLSNRINSEGVLQISSQSERTQLANKERCIEKFNELIEKALFVPKIRKKSTPSKRVIQKRLDEKKLRSEKKDRRKKI